MTGYMDDGAAGLAAIKAAGGSTVVQHPVDAFAPPIPLSAIATGQIDFCLPLVAIPPLLSWLCRLSPDLPLSTGTAPGTSRAQASTRSGVMS